MDKPDDIDCGTIEEACYRGVIGSIVKDLIKLYKSPNDSGPKQSNVKIQWPTEEKEFLNYTRCCIEYNAVSIHIYCVRDILKIEAFEPHARYFPENMRLSMHQPFFVNQHNETTYKLADPGLHNKAIKLISTKLDKYLGDPDV